MTATVMLFWYTCREHFGTQDLASVVYQDFAAMSEIPLATCSLQTQLCINKIIFFNYNWRQPANYMSVNAAADIVISPIYEGLVLIRFTPITV